MTSISSGSLSEFLRQLLRPRRRLDGCQRNHLTFSFGNNLLRHHQNIVIDKFELLAPAGIADQLSRLNLRHELRRCPPSRYSSTFSCATGAFADWRNARGEQLLRHARRLAALVSIGEKPFEILGLIDI